MKKKDLIAIHITDRTLFSWPSSYWSELIGDLVKGGHNLFVFSDEKHVNLDFKNENIVNCCGMKIDEVRDIMKQCDVFIGVPLKYSDIAKAAGIRVINLLGSTLKGEGVVSPLVCAGCIDKGNSEIDCVFQDELCMWRITPIMVKREVDKLNRSII